MSASTHGTTPYYYVPAESRHPVLAAAGLFFVLLGASREHGERGDGFIAERGFAFHIGKFDQLGGDDGDWRRPLHLGTLDA